MLHSLDSRLWLLVIILISSSHPFSCVPCGAVSLTFHSRSHPSIIAGTSKTFGHNFRGFAKSHTSSPNGLHCGVASPEDYSLLNTPHLGAVTGSQRAFRYSTLEKINLQENWKMFFANFGRCTPLAHSSDFTSPRNQNFANSFVSSEHAVTELIAGSYTFHRTPCGQPPQSPKELCA